MTLRFEDINPLMERDLKEVYKYCLGQVSLEPELNSALIEARKGVEIKFDINLYWNGIFVEKAKSHYVIIGGLKVPYTLFWDELEAREKVLKAKLLELVDDEDSLKGR